MAKVSTSSGEISGKLGDRVYYIHKGKQCVRSIPKKKSSGPSEAQLTQQAKWARVIEFVNSLKGLITISYRHYKKNISPFNGVVKDTLLNAVTGCYPNFGIDYSKIQVSRGNLERSTVLQSTAGCGEINFAWNPFHRHLINHDRTILVAYCEALNQCIFTTTGPTRGTGTATLLVPEFRGHQVHTWLGFIAADGKHVANSVYTGMVKVT